MRLAAALLVGTAFGQTFEVASVKVAPDGRGGYVIRGGPGSGDPGLASFTNIDLFSLVAMSYGVQRHQVVGPEWMKSARFDVVARVAPGTSVADYRVMLHGLLAERFKLALHREKRELSVYELEVAKGGPKLEAVDADPGDGALKPPPPYSSPPLGYQGAVNVVMQKATMERMASVVSGLLGEPVIDGTGLTGAYNIKLRALIAGHATAETQDVPDLFDALPEQLGLRLVKRKLSIEVLIVDEAERVPTEN